MAALPRVRRIEEILKSAQLDPRLIAIICEIAERQRVQHQQMYDVAKLIVGLQESYIEIVKKIGIRDGNLEKLGVKEMMQKLTEKGAGFVQSVEEFDMDPSVHNQSRETKN